MSPPINWILDPPLAFNIFFVATSYNQTFCCFPRNQSTGLAHAAAVPNAIDRSTVSAGLIIPDGTRLLPLPIGREQPHRKATTVDRHHARTTRHLCELEHFMRESILLTLSRYANFTHRLLVDVKARRGSQISSSVEDKLCRPRTVTSPGFLHPTPSDNTVRSGAASFLYPRCRHRRHRGNAMRWPAWSPPPAETFTGGRD